MTNDPFLDLRLPNEAVDPAPEFRARLRDRIERALAEPQGATMTATTFTPPRLHTMTPYLCCTNARDAIGWYGEAFGAELLGETFPMSATDDRLGHAELRIGDSVFMLSDEWPEGDTFSPTTRGGATTAFVVYVPDVDATFDRAVELGATALRPVGDGPYGSRAGWLRDPFGHRWSLATSLGTGDPYADAVSTPSASFHAEDIFEEVGYYVMSRPDLARAKSFYGGVFGWEFAAENDTPSGGRGAHVTNSKVPFGLTDDTTIGAFHPWFRVRDLDASLFRIRELGGEVLDVTTYASGGGARCRDDQGVEFEIYEPAPGY